MKSKLHLEDKDKLKSELKDFYLEYDNNLVLQKNITFGYEIEFKIPGYSTNFMDFITNNLNDDISNLRIYIDSFLRKIGYKFPWNVTYEVNEHLEVISPILTGTKKEWETLKSVLEFLKENNAYYSGECGAHIHIGKRILENNKEAWINFLMLWYLFEDTIIKFTNGENYFERKNFSTSSKRCKNDIYKLINNFNDDYILSKNLFNKTSSIMLGRNNVGDLVNYSKDGYSVKDTIEFRCPNGTLNHVIWQNNTRFFSNLLSSYKNGILDEEMLKYYMNKDNQKGDFLEKPELFLVDLIFSEDYDKYCFLRQYYKDFNEPKSYNPHVKSSRFWK